MELLSATFTTPTLLCEWANKYGSLRSVFELGHMLLSPDELYAVQMEHSNIAPQQVLRSSLVNWLFRESHLPQAKLYEKAQECVTLIAPDNLPTVINTIPLIDNKRPFSFNTVDLLLDAMLPLTGDQASKLGLLFCDGDSLLFNKIIEHLNDHAHGKILFALVDKWIKNVGPSFAQFKLLTDCLLDIGMPDAALSLRRIELENDGPKSQPIEASTLIDLTDSPPKNLDDAPLDLSVL